MTSAVLSASFAVFLDRCRFTILKSVLTALVSICLLFNGTIATAQLSAKTRATKVAVAEVTFKTVAEFSELPGRLIAGSTESITVLANAEIEILNRQLGDFVSNGQNIAKQDPAKLVLNRSWSNLSTTKIKHTIFWPR